MKFSYHFESPNQTILDQVEAALNSIKEKLGANPKRGATHIQITECQRSIGEEFYVPFAGKDLIETATVDDSPRWTADFKNLQPIPDTYSDDSIEDALNNIRQENIEKTNPNLEIYGTTVEVSVAYGMNGMIDAKNAAETWAKVFSEKLGCPIKGTINPGDSSCGIKFTAPTKGDTNNLLDLLESQFDLENQKTIRETFPIPGDIIQVELKTLMRKDTRYLYATDVETGIKVFGYGEDRENGAITIEIPKDEMEDYIEGAVITEEICEGTYDDSETHVRFLLIPKSRMEEIKKYAKSMGIDAFELGKRSSEIGKQEVNRGIGLCGIKADRVISASAPNKSQEKTAPQQDNEPATITSDSIAGVVATIKKTGPKVDLETYRAHVPEFVTKAGEPTEKAVEISGGTPERSPEEKGKALIAFFKLATKEKVVAGDMKAAIQNVQGMLDKKGYIRKAVFASLPQADKKALKPLVKSYAAQMEM